SEPCCYLIVGWFLPSFVVGLPLWVFSWSALIIDTDQVMVFSFINLASLVLQSGVLPLNRCLARPRGL
ncbi:hypothetical protein TorRG33x02_293570, partial [Trema orientale]